VHGSVHAYTVCIGSVQCAHAHPKHSHCHFILVTLSTGLVSDCPLFNYIPSTCSPQTTDNDGLWTSWLVAAEVFRYKVTGNSQAKSNAWELFRGMQFLYNVSNYICTFGVSRKRMGAKRHYTFVSIYILFPNKSLTFM